MKMKENAVMNITVREVRLLLSYFWYMIAFEYMYKEIVNLIQQNFFRADNLRAWELSLI